MSASMRSAVSLLLFVLTAIVGPVEAAVSPDRGWQAPVETHVPSEIAEESEIDEMQVHGLARSATAHPPTGAPADTWALGMMKATPPTPPPR